jgi:hypothetical protein
MRNEKTYLIKAAHRTVKGFYKASVMGVNENNELKEHFSTGWKPNTILNCGLDKIAYMPWAQTFQFCLVGDYPYTSADPLTASFNEKMLKRPKKINSFYCTGKNNCGHIISGSTVRLFRTFDFYKELDNTVYTEIGFKETPAAPELFSKIRLDPYIQIHAGQFLRINYELRVNMNPTTGSNGGIEPNPLPSFVGWTTSSLDREAIQKVGMCGIDSGSGLCIPIDEAGFCNEPFAPGQLSFGPGFGFVNRYYNGSNVNYLPTSSNNIPVEPNVYKAIGPLQEFCFNYENPYRFLDYSISASLVISNGKYSGSFCVPFISQYRPRNYFTSDLFYEYAKTLRSIYTDGSLPRWSVYPTTAFKGTETLTNGVYYISQVNGSIVSVDYRWYFGNDIPIENTAVSAGAGGGGLDGPWKFTKLDNLWTPYCKLSTLRSFAPYDGALLSDFNNNTNLINDLFYDPSQQNSGSLSYPKYPSKLLVPAGLGTGSKYETFANSSLYQYENPSISTVDNCSIVSGSKLILANIVRDKKIPVHFPFWDDWNPFQNTSSLANLPIWVKRTGWTGTLSSPNGKLGTNYYVRGTSCFLSTHTGSATSSFNTIDRSKNTTTKVWSVELPTYLSAYTQSNYYRDKYSIFTNGVANNEDIPASYRSNPSSVPLYYTIGLGPTSLNIVPFSMNDAAKNNGYVYVLNTGATKSKDYSLKIVWRYSWGRA